MKKVLFSFVMAALLLTGCYQDDIDNLNDKYDGLKTEQQTQAQLIATLQSALNAKVTITGVVETTDGYEISFSDGKKVRLTQGKDGSTIADIQITDDHVEFKFSDGKTITVPMTRDLINRITGAAAVQYFEFGEVREFTITQKSVQSLAIAKPDGWRVVIDGSKLTITAPAENNTFAETSGTVSFIATSSNATAIASMEVHAQKWNFTHTIHFEDAGDYVATAPDGSGVKAGGYKHAGSGIVMPNTVTVAEWGTSWSGIAVSQWKDITIAGLSNQLSVYNKNGGYSGSKTFAVANGYYNAAAAGWGGDPEGRSVVTFEDEATEASFEYIWVTNSTYTALSMMTGDQFSKKFSYDEKDWYKLVITAYDKSDKQTGKTVEYYLADFRTATSPGILTTWAKVDLTPLGNKVHTVKFDLQSSDTGDWGMNTPGYFCFDNLTIRK